MWTGVNLVSGGDGVRLLCTRRDMSSVNFSLFSPLTLFNSCLLEFAGVQVDFNELLLSEVREEEVN